jgi:3-deoxy-manno-octulosonate cytidylyltransferase (CMP-KDO synthetase)
LLPAGRPWHTTRGMSGSPKIPRVLGVIPARLESVRLPRKPLRELLGHPMIAWVYYRARPAPSLGGLLVATDSEEVAAACRQRAIPVEMTSAEHRSGTDRLVEVMGRRPAEIYVNIQGDEPMVTAEHLELLLEPFRRDTATQVSTLKVALSAEEARDPNNVKVVTDAGGRALYFSRALIPHDRDAPGRAAYFKHLGLYAYTAAALEKFAALPPSPLELLEKLEQLRFLENGIPIAVVETAEDTVGVDTEENLRAVEAYFRQRGVRFSQLSREP